MDKKRKFPKSKDFPLNKYEKEALNKTLDEVEWKEYQQVKHQTSGFVESKITHYDKDTVYFDVIVGVDGQWSRTYGFNINRLEMLLSL